MSEPNDEHKLPFREAVVTIANLNAERDQFKALYETKADEYVALVGEHTALMLSADDLRRQVERWHKAAMDAGVIVFMDGHLEYPVRDQRDKLQALVYEACANFNPDDAPEPDGLIEAIRGLHAQIAGLEAQLRSPDKDRRHRYISGLLCTRGYFNRSDITGAFGVSVPQASADIQLWLKVNPGEASYNASAKRYERVESES